MARLLHNVRTWKGLALRWHCDGIALALVLSIVLSIAHFEDALQQCRAAIIAEANHAVFH